MPKQKAGKARAKKSAPYDKSTKLNEEDVSREPENGQEDEEILKCDKCKASVEGLIQCESCMLWHCCSCGNFPFETVEVVKVCKTLHWYCEPCDNTANAQNHSDQLLTNIENLLVFGDVNFPDINWNNYSASNSVSSTFCDTIYDLNLTQLVTG